MHIRMWILVPPSSAFYYVGSELHVDKLGLLDSVRLSHRALGLLPLIDIENFSLETKIWWDPVNTCHTTRLRHDYARPHRSRAQAGPMSGSDANYIVNGLLQSSNVVHDIKYVFFVDCDVICWLDTKKGFVCCDSNALWWAASSCRHFWLAWDSCSQHVLRQECHPGE